MGYAESQILPRSKPLQHICLMHRRLPPLEHLYQGMLVSTFWGKHSAVVPASLHAQPTDKWETLQKSHHFLFLSLLPTAKNKIKREKKNPPMHWRPLLSHLHTGTCLPPPPTSTASLHCRVKLPQQGAQLFKLLLLQNIIDCCFLYSRGWRLLINFKICIQFPFPLLSKQEALVAEAGC